MADSIIIIDPDDIAIADNCVKDLDDYKTYVFDPELVDKVRLGGLKNIEFLPWLDCPKYFDLDSESEQTAVLFGKNIDSAVKLFLPGISISTWQHLNLYYMFIQMKWYKALWDDVINRFSGTRVHFFIRNSPSTYYFNSFMPAVFLMDRLNASGIKYIGYVYGEANCNPDFVPNLSLIRPGAVQRALLVHIPTTYHDAEYFCDEIALSEKPVVNVEARFWNVPVKSDTNIGLANLDYVIGLLEDSERSAVDRISKELYIALESALCSWIPIPEYCKAQAKHLTYLYRSQLVTYFLLLRCFEVGSISRMVLSDHDTGFHGPLISFADRLGLPVFFLPHSKGAVNTEFLCDNLTILSHPIQGPVVRNANGISVRCQKLAYPEGFRGTSNSNEIKKISILLNALTLNGVYFSRWQEYFDGLRTIINFARGFGLELAVRCKPGRSVVSLLEDQLGLDPDMLMKSAREPLDQHLSGCDICLMYDLPTTASLRFLANSVPVLNPVIAPFVNKEIGWLNSDIVCQEDVQTTVNRLSGYVRDPISFHTFRAWQFSKYVSLFNDARPLRAYL